MPIFLVAAFSLTWIPWFVMIAHSPDLRWLHFFGSLGPAAAGVIVIGLTRGSTGLLSLLVDVTRWRGVHGTWVVALLLPLGLYGLGITTASSTIVLIVINAGLIVASVLAVTRSRVLTQGAGNTNTRDAEQPR